MTGDGDAKVAFETDVTRCLDSNGGYATNQGGNVVAFDYCAQGSERTRIVRSGEYAQMIAGRPDAIAFQPRYARNGRGAPDTVAAPLTAEAGRTGKGDSAQCIAFQQDATDKFSEGIAPTMRGKSNGGTRAYGVAAPAFGVRRLTPTECRRLQNFPDDWNDGQSDSAAYRQLGNAVCVANAEWIGHRIVGLDTPPHL
jgi:site-specific DNA-cytosine methylase